jgi:hypothetical protein
LEGISILIRTAAAISLEHTRITNNVCAVTRRPCIAVLVSIVCNMHVTNCQIDCSIGLPNNQLDVVDPWVSEYLNFFIGFM